MPSKTASSTTSVNDRRWSGSLATVRSARGPGWSRSTIPGSRPVRSARRGRAAVRHHDRRPLPVRRGQLDPRAGSPRAQARIPRVEDICLGKSRWLLIPLARNSTWFSRPALDSRGFRAPCKAAAASTKADCRAIRGRSAQPASYGQQSGQATAEKWYPRMPAAGNWCILILY